MNIPKIKIIRPGLFMGIVFLIILLFEGFLLYAKVYKNLSAEPQTVSTESIVRLDLISYDKTIRFLDDLRNFSVAAWDLINPNPF